MKKHIVFIILIFVFLLFPQCNNRDIILSNIDNAPDSSVYTMAVYKDELYVGGCFDSIGKIKSKYIAKWNDKKWDSVGKGLNLGYRGVTALVVYKGELYAAGDFEIINNSKEVYHIAKWNGKKWQKVGDGKPDGTYPCINALCVYKNELYAAGLFDRIGDVRAKNIAKWNGNRWENVKSGVNYTIITLAVFKNELYAGGICNQEDGYSVKWNGTRWKYLTHDTIDFTEVQSYTIFEDNLLIGGTFGRYIGGSGGRTGFNPFNHIAKYNGSSYKSFDEGIDDNEASINSMSVYKNELFIGGKFDFPKGKKGNNIIKWNGVNWQTVAIDNSGYVSCFATYKDKLYAGGTFQSLNGKPISFLTKMTLSN
jgi:hypothetical protein